MKLIWKIGKQDIAQLNAFFDEHKNNAFVQERIKRNINGKNRRIDRESFFQGMVSCLMTTQQRSGPDSPASKFIKSNPFPLSYKKCLSATNTENFVNQTIANFGGLRRSNRIADEVSTNLLRLEEGLWHKILKIVNDLNEPHEAQQEREVAEYINNELKGFGPKQSRNLLQYLGLSQYEIPIDSRITKWLNDFGFPVKLSANALSDRNYYNFISDGIQILCNAAGIMPCLLDAAIFSSYDSGFWTNENVVW